MRIATLLLGFYLLGGCTSVQPLELGGYLNASTDRPTLQYIHQDLMSKFTFVPQPAETDVYKHHSGYSPFTGDCDDYLSAAKNRLIDSGYIPVAVTGYKSDGEFHVFTCAHGRELVCLDPNYSRARSLSALRRTLKDITVYHYPDLQPFRTAEASSSAD